MKEEEFEQLKERFLKAESLKDEIRLIDNEIKQWGKGEGIETLRLKRIVNNRAEILHVESGFVDFDSLRKTTLANLKAERKKLKKVLEDL